MRHGRLAVLFAASAVLCAPGLGQAARAVWETFPRVSDPDTMPLAFVTMEGPTERGRLLVCGDFQSLGPTPATGIATWDGKEWHGVTTALRPAGASGGRAVVRCAARFDDGSGEAWYFGGSFTDTTGTIRNIARWRGGGLEAVGTGLGGGLQQEVRALVVHDDGSGPALIAGGTFNQAGQPKYLARWRGGSWESMGVIESFGSVDALWSEDDGPLRGLYVGGQFGTIGGVPVRNIARWDGAEWLALDRGLSWAVQQIVVFDRGDGLGRQLWIRALVWPTGAHRWTGESWIAEPSIPRGPWWLQRYQGTERLLLSAEGLGVGELGPSGINVIAPYDDSGVSAQVAHVYDPGWGDGERIVVSTHPSSSGGPGFTSRGKLMTWGSGEWRRADEAWGWTHGLVAADLGEGPRLFASSARVDGGNRGTAWSWDGMSAWATLAPARDPGPGEIVSMLRFGSGDGSIYAASGPKLNWSGMIRSDLYRLRQGQWETVGGGVGFQTQNGFFADGAVTDCVAFDDGRGPGLYVCGRFTLAGGLGGVAVQNIARWDGAAWERVGEIPMENGQQLYDLQVFDDGGGAQLFASGRFRVPGDPAFVLGSVARWDGAVWTVENREYLNVWPATAMTVWERDGEARLVSIGRGGLRARRGDGTWETWSSEAAGTEASGLFGWRAEGPGGERDVLVAFANSFQSYWPYMTGAAPVRVWDGRRWSVVRADVTVPGQEGTIHRSALWDAGEGDRLYVAGVFSRFNDGPASNVASLVSVEVTCAGDADFGGQVGMEDLSLVLGAFGESHSLDEGDAHPADLDMNGVVDFRDLVIVLGNYGTTCE